MRPGPQDSWVLFLPRGGVWGTVVGANRLGPVLGGGEGGRAQDSWVLGLAIGGGGVEWGRRRNRGSGLLGSLRNPGTTDRRRIWEPGRLGSLYPALAVGVSSVAGLQEV